LTGPSAVEKRLAGMTSERPIDQTFLRPKGQFMTRLTVKSSVSPAVSITREAVKSDKLVYIAVANKPISYSHGKSRIVYIGTTKNGAHRMAASAAAKAREMLDLHGVRQLDFYAVTCKSRQNVQTWRVLERALLLAFKQMYGQVPECNTQGSKMVWRDELKYFTQARLESVIEQYSS
jgi:hypothetical protein